ncbi:MAG TPA: N-acetyltransferase [Longimicrobium sp.]|nr:N-acetyltransferase [Longimicrobium sp.]
MLTIRAESPGDAAAIAAIHRRAFGQEDEPRLVDALRESDAFIPELSLLAEEDGAVVGHVLVSRVVVRTPRGDVPALSLAPLGVEPGRQRRGVGTALMREALKRARASGYGLMVVLGHPPYYARFGFVPAKAYGLYCRWPVEDEVYRVLELRAGALAGVEGEVLYPPPFDAL